MTTIHPDYAILAARIAISNLHKETKKSFSATMKDLREYVNPKNGKWSPMISTETYEAIMENGTLLSHAQSSRHATHAASRKPRGVASYCCAFVTSSRLPSRAGLVIWLFDHGHFRLTYVSKEVHLTLRSGYEGEYDLLVPYSSERRTGDMFHAAGDHTGLGCRVIPGAVTELYSTSTSTM